MKAILTRILAPTNTKGSRIVADDHDGNRLIMPLRHELPQEKAHYRVVKALCEKMGWNDARSLVYGYLGDRMVWVWPDRTGAELEQTGQP